MSSQDPQSKPSKRQLEQAGASDQSIQDVHSALLREKAEPSESFAPLPLILLFVFSTLIFAAALYLGKYSGDFNGMIYNEHAHVQPAGQKSDQPVDPRVIGKRIFMNNCATCHQPTGLGQPGIYPPLAGSEWVLGNEEVTARILLHGLKDPVKVKGATYNGSMPSFGDRGETAKLRDDQLASLLTYIRSEWGNDAPAVTVETVARIRAETKERTSPFREADLLPLRDAKPATP